MVWFVCSLFRMGTGIREKEFNPVDGANDVPPR
jgi:hypothetical protein